MDGDGYKCPRHLRHDVGTEGHGGDMDSWGTIRPDPVAEDIRIVTHSMDGVLFCAGSLDGLWLIHDNYPSSIPLFYIVWDTLRNLT